MARHLPRGLVPRNRRLQVFQPHAHFDEIVAKGVRWRVQWQVEPDAPTTAHNAGVVDLDLAAVRNLEHAASL